MTTVLLFITGLFAGSFGSLLGLGGGVIVIPVLSILFGLPIHTAIGISLVGVIATSTGAAVVYIRDRKVNIKLGMTLELGSTVGAVAGAVVAGYIGAKVLYFLFAGMVVYNAYSMYRQEDKNYSREGHAAAHDGYPTVYREGTGYVVKYVPLGVLLSSLAGVTSGLLGVGGGLIKIPVMYLLMGVPLKEAAATSNFMIGVTASASAIIYYLNGNIDVVAAVPVALGVFGGAAIGTRINERISVRSLKKVFVFVFIYVALQMFIKGFGG
ncbi:sulfite exporter TauE/SafE family protein [Phosphitispora sp. TUW77]|uniref:sulfite exporter TauE/SafE family protein n=1 Tax=Phosphitispora sp. TUW77 TaxID=3152361 RepID=UPI003AB148AF